MTPDLTDLARRAVACKGWRWMPGMLALPSGYRVRVVQYDAGAAAGTGVRMLTTGGWASALVQCDDLPDLSDPATLGCILALVREAWGDPRIHAAPALYSHESPPEYQYTISHWHVYSPGPYNPMTEPPKCAVTEKTEAATLIAALEAAP